MFCIRQKLFPMASLFVAVTLLVFAAGPLPLALADNAPTGTTYLNEFGLNGDHNQVIETGSNRGFTADWTLKGPAIMDPAVIDGVLYGDTSKPPYGAAAINPVNGHVLWFHPFANQMMNSPIYDHGTLFFGLGNNKFPAVPVVSHPDLRGAGLNQVVAVNANTGVTQWVYNTAGEDMPTFVLHQQGLFVANGADQVLELSPESGHVMRSLAIPSYVSMSSPTVVGHTAYFGGAFPYTMYAINLNTMTVSWATHTRAVAGLDDDPPVVGNGQVYIGAVYDDQGQSAAMLLAFNQSTGKLTWSSRIGFGVRPTSGPLFESGVPLLTPSALYAGSSISNAVYAINPKTGNVLWSNPLAGQQIAQAPVIIGQRLLVGDNSGKLFVLNATNGKLLKTIQFPGGGFMPGVPFVVGNTIFLSTRGGMMFARPISTLIAPAKP